jgi:hypothetical protein
MCHIRSNQIHGSSAAPDGISIVPRRCNQTGQAGLLCHSHNETLWSQTTLTVKGRRKRRGDDWVFVSTAFTPRRSWRYCS